MKLTILSLFLIVSTVASAVPTGSPSTFDAIRRLQDWNDTLPITASAGDGYVAAPWGRRHTYQDYQAAWHAALHGSQGTEGVILSCARRCGRTRIWGFYATHPNGLVDYALVCRCENIVNWHGEPPWPPGFRLPPPRR